MSPAYVWWGRAKCVNINGALYIEKIIQGLVETPASPCTKQKPNQINISLQRLNLDCEMKQITPSSF